MDGMAASEATRIHERLDQLLERMTDIKSTLDRAEERSAIINETVRDHHVAIHGNGKDGLLVRVAKLEATGGGVDRLSVKGMVGLVAAVGGLAAAVGGVMAAILQWLQGGGS